MLIAECGVLLRHGTRRSVGRSSLTGWLTTRGSYRPVTGRGSRLAYAPTTI
jgi:hypothetical protein